jgi:hypothetical protein
VIDFSAWRGLSINCRGRGLLSPKTKPHGLVKLRLCRTAAIRLRWYTEEKDVLSMSMSVQRSIYKTTTNRFFARVRKNALPKIQTFQQASYLNVIKIGKVRLGQGNVNEGWDALPLTPAGRVLYARTVPALIGSLSTSCSADSSSAGVCSSTGVTGYIAGHNNMFLAYIDMQVLTSTPAIIHLTAAKIRGTRQTMIHDRTCLSKSWKSLQAREAYCVPNHIIVRSPSEERTPYL